MLMGVEHICSIKLITTIVKISFFFIIIVCININVSCFCSFVRLIIYNGETARAHIYLGI